jgi:ubiquinone/menaquinone biosynthesis C-methylase UbiE
MSDFSQSRIAARLQEVVSKRREEAGLYREIAEQLPLTDGGRLLDVGTGTGLQLRVIHGMRPGMKLFGIDLSDATIRLARENLASIDVDLREGSIESTPYDDDFFDVVTCNASMSYWANPVACLDEIYRILKPGGVAMLFEPLKGVNIDEVVETIRANLADKSWLRRFAAVNLNRFGLRWGHKLGLKLYSADELAVLASRSKFGNRQSIDRLTLQNLPIFARITLTK